MNPTLQLTSKFGPTNLSPISSLYFLQNLIYYGGQNGTTCAIDTESVNTSTIKQGSANSPKVIFMDLVDSNGSSLTTGVITSVQESLGAESENGIVFTFNYYRTY
jgi:hypothetical protein